MKSWNLLRRWKRRYFLLEDKTLSCFTSEACLQRKAVINFDLVTVQVLVLDPKTTNEIWLCPLASKVIFKLRGQNSEEVKGWASALHQHIQSSVGRRLDMSAYSSHRRWWRYDRISERTFLAEAATGDILLFRSKSCRAKMQRIVSRSEHDHIALVLRYSSGRLGILEATDLEGVSIVLWEDFMRFRWHLLYSRIEFRHLELERSDEVLQDLELFIKDVKDKDFRISSVKLCGNKKQDPGKEKHFFCSELVAAAYRRLHLLPEEVASSKYWPGDFAKPLELALGTLGRPQLIDFMLV
jgi:hypothetical protein